MTAKKNFVIQTPRGSIYTVKTANGTVTAKMEWNQGFSGRREAGFSKAQGFVDSECIRRMNPETPRLTGVLIVSNPRNSNCILERLIRSHPMLVDSTMNIKKSRVGSSE